MSLNIAYSLLTLLALSGVALHTVDAGGIHILLFVSIKLGLANHTAILDTAVLPLSHNMMTDGMVQKFLGGLQSSSKV